MPSGGRGCGFEPRQAYHDCAITQANWHFPTQAGREIPQQSRNVTKQSTGHLYRRDKTWRVNVVKPVSFAAQNTESVKLGHRQMLQGIFEASQGER
jgi:hypothetical protein